MKKLLSIAFTVTLLFSVGTVLAKEETENVKIKNVKIHKKQVLSEKDRKQMEEEFLKGKPSSLADKKPVAFKPLATGVLGPQTSGEKYALIIGMANYEGIDNDLCVYSDDGNSENDAATYLEDPQIQDGLTYYCQDSDSLHLQDALKSEYGYGTENIILVRDGKATLEEVKFAMAELKTKITDSNNSDNAEVVFFFSGHGTRGDGDVDKYDTDGVHEGIYLYDNKAIWDWEIKAWADSLGIGIEEGSGRIVFGFDTCLAGGMNNLEGTNHMVAMSSGELQSSWTFYLGGTQTGEDSWQESEGLFSHYFVKRGMFNYEGKPDGANLLAKRDPKKYDYHVAVEEAFSYAYPLVKFKQTPVLGDFDKIYDLLLGYL